MGKKCYVVSTGRTPTLIWCKMSQFSFTPPRPAKLRCIDTARNKEEKLELLIADTEQEQSRSTEICSEDKLSRFCH